MERPKCTEVNLNEGKYVEQITQLYNGQPESVNPIAWRRQHWAAGTSQSTSSVYIVRQKKSLYYQDISHYKQQANPSLKMFSLFSHLFASY